MGNVNGGRKKVTVTGAPWYQFLFNGFFLDISMGKVAYSHRQKFARYPGGDSAGRNAANKSNNDPNPRNQPMLMRQYGFILLKIDEILPRLSLRAIHRRNSSRIGPFWARSR